MIAPRGGTEILYSNLLKYVDNQILSQVNLMVSACSHDMITSDKPNILWQHLNTDQRVALSLRDTTLVDRLDKIVFVSHWQRSKFCAEFSIPFSKTTVIHNAIEPINYVQPQYNQKTKLIYTSMPFRGLDVLLAAFARLNRNDVELTVFSSNIIYGKDYSRIVGKAYEPLFEQCRRMPNVIYRGYAMNKAIRAELSKSHILAYPSTFEETSCLTAIEAGAAGCRIVTTDLGALTETCADYADYVPYTTNTLELAETYAAKLNTVIDLYQQHSYDSRQQSDWFNQQYSWHNQAVIWNKFLQESC